MAEVFLLLLLVMWLWLPQTEVRAQSAKSTMTDPFQHPYKYYQHGDLIIGAIATQFGFLADEIYFRKHPKTMFNDELLATPKNYQHVLSLVFAVKEINENPKILPNVSLGFQIYDSYFNARMTHQNILRLLSNWERTFPNYICDKEKNLVAVIGGRNSDISLQMAIVLDIYRVPQIAYCVLAPVTNIKNQFPSFYRMVPSEVHQYKGIVHLLVYFQWMWVGITASDDESGDRFVQTLMPMLSQDGICTAVIEKIPAISQAIQALSLASAQDEAKSLINSNVSVYVVNARSQTITGLTWMIYLSTVLKGVTRTAIGKVWIMTAHWDFSFQTMQRSFDIQIFDGTLSFAIHSSEVQGFPKYLQNLHPSLQNGDDFLKVFWKEAFDCVAFDSNDNKDSGDICTGQEKLESLPGTLCEMSMTGQSYSIYNSVHAIAYALNEILSTQDTLRAMKDRYRMTFPNLKPWQLHPFLRSISFNNSAGDTVSFDENGELAAGFDIVNWVTFPNQSFSQVKVGRMDPQASHSQAFTVYEEAITWHNTFNQVLPLALCNDKCDPGYSRKKKEGEPFCCYDCVLCPDGKISDQKDMDDCFRCPEEKFPNKNRNQCLPKHLNFLSFTESLGITLTFLAFCFCLITTLVLGMFIRNKDTPIVKANNRDLTYTLLIFLFLCFLCSLLFIGHPQAVTCYVRQVAFGVIFSVAVSCVLSKTITVVLAFMATKPGSRLRKWVGKRLTNSILLGCSLTQVSICAVWLCVAPPFPNLDTNSLAEEIIVECNEGSITMFYCVLGYLGFLAIVSFIVAFLARKLPDSFNEAKFITFSMLVFCTVWLSFVPSYLSTKGKSMVAVEIFSILASGAALLGFIFFPKCYIIILRPELNCKDQLMRRM